MSNPSPRSLLSQHSTPGLQNPAEARQSSTIDRRMFPTPRWAPTLDYSSNLLLRMRLMLSSEPPAMLHAVACRCRKPRGGTIYATKEKFFQEPRVSASLGCKLVRKKETKGALRLVRKFEDHALESEEELEFSFKHASTTLLTGILRYFCPIFLWLKKLQDRPTASGKTSLSSSVVHMNAMVIDLLDGKSRSFRAAVSLSSVRQGLL